MRWHMPSPKTWGRVHATLTVAWALLMIPSLIWWKESLLWIIIMSCWANIAGSAASYQAAMADCNSPTVEHIDRLERKIESIRRRLDARR